MGNGFTTSCAVPLNEHIVALFLTVSVPLYVPAGAVFETVIVKVPVTVVKFAAAIETLTSGKPCVIAAPAH